MAGNHSSKETNKLRPTRRHTLKLAVGAAIGSATSSTSVTAQAVAEASTVYAVRNDGLHAINVDTGTDEWIFDQESELSYSSPTVADGTVYIGSENKTLYAINAATGEQIWTYTEPSHEIRSSPTVVDGTVFVGGSPFGNGTVHAVNAATGEQEWTFTEPDNGAPAPPNVVNDAVYIPGIDGTVYSIDAETGEKNWSHSFFDAQISSRPTVADGTVYIGTSGFTLKALDADSGEEQWSVDEYTGVISVPTVVDGTVYAGAGPYDDVGPLFAVNATTGEVEWEFSTPDGIRDEGGPTVYDGVVYVGTEGGELYAVDADTGDQKWVLSNLADGINSVPTAFNNKVYISTSKSVRSVDAVTGEQDWVLNVDGGEQSSPTVVKDPQEGDSVGSRVRLGTLGHTDYWAVKSTADTTVAINNVGASAWEVTSIEGDAASAPLNENNPQILLQENKRFMFENNGWPTHPLEIQSAEGTALLSQADNTMGSFEDDSNVNWVDNGDEVAFTLTKTLSAEMNNYVCTVHTNAMVGNISTSVELRNVTLDNNTIAADGSTHSLSFDVFNLSPDDDPDEFTIQMPENVDIDSIDSIEASNDIDIIEQPNASNPLKFEVDPASPIEDPVTMTVDLTLSSDRE